MQATINELNPTELSDLVLDVRLVEGNPEDSWLSFSFVYHLSVSDGSNGKVLRGTIESCVMTSRNVLDDQDATDYQIASEVVSVGHVSRYLSEKYKPSQVTGTVTSSSQGLSHPLEREYRF